jgi:hypothetical protein
MGKMRKGRRRQDVEDWIRLPRMISRGLVVVTGEEKNAGLRRITSRGRGSICRDQGAGASRTGLGCRTLNRSPAATVGRLHLGLGGSRGGGWVSCPETSERSPPWTPLRLRPAASLRSCSRTVGFSRGHTATAVVGLDCGIYRRVPLSVLMRNHRVSGIGDLNYPACAKKSRRFNVGPNAFAWLALPSPAGSES